LRLRSCGDPGRQEAAEAVFRAIFPIVLLVLAACAAGPVSTVLVGGTAVDVRIGIDRIEGAPAAASAVLRGELVAVAAGRRIGLVESGATLLLRGYFSVVASSAGTLVVYVWDLTDIAGNRLHRISRQQTTTAIADEPWDVVAGTMARQIATDTIYELELWLSANRAGA
jgi:hypothetical protein